MRYMRKIWSVILLGKKSGMSLLVCLLLGILAIGTVRLSQAAGKSAWTWQPPPPDNEGALLFVSRTGSESASRQIPVGAQGPAVNRITSATSEEEIYVHPGCYIRSQEASPNGRWIAITVTCPDYVGYTQVLEVATAQVRWVEPEFTRTSIFLNWAPDGDTIVLRTDPIEKSAIFLVNLADGTQTQLNVPSNTYYIHISPDGQRVLYTVDIGFKKGSELWLMNRDGSKRQLAITEPLHDIVYPRWSPKGDYLAYIRVPDNEIPYQVGELWVANKNGRQPRMIASADGRHGYPLVWSPDGTSVAFVVRENPDNARADRDPLALESNIYLADVKTGNTRALTHFKKSLVDGVVWSPNGSQIAFRAVSAGASEIWLANLSGDRAQLLTSNADAIAPVWISKPER